MKWPVFIWNAKLNLIVLKLSVPAGIYLFIFINGDTRLMSLMFWQSRSKLPPPPPQNDGNQPHQTVDFINFEFVYSTTFCVSICFFWSSQREDSYKNARLLARPLSFHSIFRQNGVSVFFWLISLCWTYS